MGTQSSHSTRLKNFKGAFLLFVLVMLLGYAYTLNQEPVFLFFIGSLILLVGTTLNIVIKLIRKLI